MRYKTSGKFEGWMNELIEELNEKEFLPEIIKEAGCVVTNEIWFKKPIDLVQAIECRSPVDDTPFRIEDVEGKYRLADRHFSSLSLDPLDADVIAADVTAGLSLNIITIDSSGTIYVKDQFKKNLALIVDGTLAGKTLLLTGNAESAEGATDLNLLHAMKTPMTSDECSAILLFTADRYALLKYYARLMKIENLSDELPFEIQEYDRLALAWLTWKAERDMDMSSNDAKTLQNDTEILMQKMRSSKNNRPMLPARGRRLAGMERTSMGMRKRNPDYQSYL